MSERSIQASSGDAATETMFHSAALRKRGTASAILHSTAIISAPTTNEARTSGTRSAGMRSPSRRELLKRLTSIDAMPSQNRRAKPVCSSGASGRSCGGMSTGGAMGVKVGSSWGTNSFSIFCCSSLQYSLFSLPELLRSASSYQRGRYFASKFRFTFPFFSPF